MVAGLTKQAQTAQTDFVAYSIIIFQALALAVMRKSISLNVDTDFENAQVYDAAYSI